MIDKIQVFVFRFVSFSLCGLLERQNPLDDKFFFFLLLKTRFGRD